MSAARVLIGVITLIGVAAVLTTCRDSVEPPLPGWVDVRLTSPNGDDGGILFTVSGAQIDSVRSAFPNTFTRQESASVVRVIVTGTLTSGVVAQVFVPDVHVLSPYATSLVEIASRTFEQRSPAGYTLELSGPGE